MPVLSLSLKTQFFESAITPFSRQLVKSFEGLTFKESFFADRLIHESTDKSPHDIVINVFKFLMFEDLCDQGEGFFRVITSKVISLRDDLLIVQR